MTTPGFEQKTVVGAKQTKRAILDGRATQVFLAKNADPHLISPIEELCATYAVHVQWVEDMRELGQNCGIAVGAAVAAQVS